METMDDMNKFRQCVLGEVDRFEERWQMGVGSPFEDELINYWKENRPKMTAKLNRMGILAETAYVLLNLADEAENKYLKAGMSLSDATEQENLDWLLREPEPEILAQQEEKAANNPLAKLGRMLDDAHQLVKDSLTK